MYLHGMNLSEYLIWEETHDTRPKYLSDMTFLIGSLSALCLFTDHEVSLGKELYLNLALELNRFGFHYVVICLEIVGGLSIDGKLPSLRITKPWPRNRTQSGALHRILPELLSYHHGPPRHNKADLYQPVWKRRRARDMYSSPFGYILQLTDLLMEAGTLALKYVDPTYWWGSNNVQTIQASQLRMTNVHNNTNDVVQYCYTGMPLTEPFSHPLVPSTGQDSEATSLAQDSRSEIGTDSVAVTPTFVVAGLRTSWHSSHSIHGLMHEIPEGKT
ncbi:hypothetical protein P167DRAFT_546789 [Morchella conica CCBAS932]|uniref:Uncharacterized protein n=1 Tax=Morchella conica CCBAS932 TaxID=1392247 RepID=A0A3N4KK12_9PEZI|nr:hypothetical protein P167DRAFT_546789 [Morchella conica CCBAS932]